MTPADGTSLTAIGPADGPAVGGCVKGIIFNITELAVTEALGAEVWEDLLDASGVAGVYSALGDYPASELVAISQAAADHLGITLEETLVWVGENVVPTLADRYPQFFEHDNTIEFIQTLDGLVHEEVRKLYEGADPPRFEVEPVGPNRVLITYSSRRCMAALAHGMIQGTAAQYGEQVVIERTDSVEDRVQTARFLCTFSREVKAHPAGTEPSEAIG